MSVNTAAKPLDASLQYWKIIEADFPSKSSLAEQIIFCLKYAVLAPSSHNSQPWLFKIVNDDIELYADRRRALSVIDPDDRELIISCGATLFHLRTALRRFGYTFAVEPFPKPTDPDLLAVIHIGSKKRATSEEKWFFNAICQRHTSRMPFEKRLPAKELLDELVSNSNKEGACLDIVSEDDRRNDLAKLISQADRIQMADKRFRRELAAWIHPNRSKSCDGLPGYSLGMGDLVSYFGPLVLRTFDLGDGRAAKDQELAAASPILAVLGTEGDSALDWLAAGQALDRVLLRACTDDIKASFLNQPIEVPELREQLIKLLRIQYNPQLVLRFGYGSSPVPTPRRTVKEVLL
ncbi:MAG: nitroreductase [Acidobacteriota bacterium]